MGAFTEAMATVTSVSQPGDSFEAPGSNQNSGGVMCAASHKVMNAWGGASLFGLQTAMPGKKDCQEGEVWCRGL